MRQSRTFIGASGALAGMVLLASIAGCLSAFSADEATSVRVSNVGADSLAVLLWDDETANRSLRVFGPAALDKSSVRNGVIAPGRSRDFPFDSIQGYVPGLAVRIEILSIQRDTVHGNSHVTVTIDALKRRGFSVDVSLR